MARSFFNYGKGESAKDAKIGDIMVRKDGSHVGRFAGLAKDGNPLFYSGNTGGGGFHRRGVDTHEENPGNFYFRRLLAPQQKQEARTGLGDDPVQHPPASVFHGVTSSEYPEPKEKSVHELTSWRGLDKNAARMMASNWGGDSVHHHYDNSDNSMTYHDNRKTNVTVTGANEPHEVAAAVGSTLDKAFSPSQAKQRFLQGAIS
jgi:hypothetical protein